MAVMTQMPSQISQALAKVFFEGGVFSLAAHTIGMMMFRSGREISRIVISHSPVEIVRELDSFMGGLVLPSTYQPPCGESRQKRRLNKSDRDFRHLAGDGEALD